MSNWERIYASPSFNPLFFWLAAAIFVAVLASRLPFLAGYLVAFTFEIAADALASGGLTPIPKGAAYATPVAIAFVILGDFRYFVLVERFAAARRSIFAALGLAAAWAFVVPVASSLLRTAFPALASPVRVTYLTYELLFLALALAFRFVVLPRRLASADPDVRRWLFEVTWLEIAHYALWAAADVVILSGQSAGFLLRFVPDALYYAAFLPFVWLRAPTSLRRFRPPDERVER